MKKIILLIGIMILFCGCQKTVNVEETTEREDLIKIHEEEGLSFYVGTPSGTLYYATNSEPVIYRDAMGETRNIYEDVEVHRQ